MPKHPNITPELLRQLLRYEPDTGKLFWLPRPMEMFTSESSWKTWSTRFSEKEAFTSRTNYGYRQGTIFYHPCLAHRVAWVIANGDIPYGYEIDHVNGLRSDNRISNLRLATRGQNVSNTTPKRNSASGVKGVWWYEKGQKWHARIRVDGKQRHLGYFSDITEASAAYVAAAETFHGQFAYHNRKNHG